MTPEEARALLDAATLIPPDEMDDEMRAALRLTDTDAELRAWFEERKAFDAQMSASLMETRPSAALRGRLLAVMSDATVIRPRFNLRPWVALAASVALLAAAALWIYQRNATPADWKDDALAIVSRLDSGSVALDEESGKLARLKTWLAQAHAPVADALPAPLSALVSLGCKQSKIAGHPASIICFVLPGSDKLAHLVVVENADAKATQGPAFRSSGGWRYATWNENGRVMMLATRASEETLRKLFA